MHLRKSDIVTEGKASTVSADLEIEVDNWLVDEIDDLVEASDVDLFMDESGVKEMTFQGVQIDDEDPYLIKAPLMIVREVIGKNEEDDEIHMGSTQIPHLLDGLAFPPLGNEEGSFKIPSFQNEPCYDMQLAVKKALYGSDIQTLDRLRKRISSFPGEFAKPNYSPDFLAACNEQEEELVWLI